MSLKPFHFKQFSVAQDKCAMKIGTDGVLLGAWVSINKQPQSILDIGAGTGVISLQLAQRSDAEQIDAVEIDENAFEQCTENFENSPWGDRLFCYHGALQDFTQELIEDQSTAGYDLIISNPPFYTDDFTSKDAARNTARFTQTLPFQHLAICVSALLNPQGIFAVVLPKKEERDFISLASGYDLFLNRRCAIKGSPTAEMKRILLEFSFEKKPLTTESLTIETERHQYTQEYINLVQDFYLKM